MADRVACMWTQKLKSGKRLVEQSHTHTHQPGKGQKAFRAETDSHIETEHALVQIPGGKLSYSKITGSELFIQPTCRPA